MSIDILILNIWQKTFLFVLKSTVMIWQMIFLFVMKTKLKETKIQLELFIRWNFTEKDFFFLYLRNTTLKFKDSHLNLLNLKYYENERVCRIYTVHSYASEKIFIQLFYRSILFVKNCDTFETATYFNLLKKYRFFFINTKVVLCFTFNVKPGVKQWNI